MVLAHLISPNTLSALHVNAARSTFLTQGVPVSLNKKFQAQTYSSSTKSMSFAVLASLPAPSAYRNPQLYTFSCVLFITFQPTSERTHHCAHYGRAICSTFGMDSCPVFPHPQIRQPGPPWLLPAGGGFPRVTFTWRLWSNHLHSSASKVKKLETSEALENAFDLERQPHLFSSTSCPALTRTEKVLLSRGRP